MSVVVAIARGLFVCAIAFPLFAVVSLASLPFFVATLGLLIIGDSDAAEDVMFYSPISRLMDWLDER